MTRGAATRVRRPLLVLAWLLATVLAGTVAWSAVAVVGGARGDDRAGVLSQADVAADLADATAAPSGTAAEPAAPAPSATGSGPAPGPTPAPNPTTTAPTTAAPPAPDADVARTWDVTGGRVGAACTGASARLLYATPADGWTVEVESTGPAEVEVDFTRDGSRTRVRAECLAGTPELTRNESGSGGGGGGSGGDDSGGDDGRGDDGPDDRGDED